MKNLNSFFSLTFTIGFIVGGLSGLFSWIQYMADALKYGDTLSFVVMLVFGGLLVPFYGLLPGIKWFILSSIGLLPIYGIYRLFKPSS